MKHESEEYQEEISNSSDHDSGDDQEENNNLDDTIIRTFTIRKGARTNKRKGILHLCLMNLA